MLADAFILSFILRFGLATLSGLRFSIPLLIVSIFARLHWLELPPDLMFLQSEPMLIFLCVELLYEISPVALQQLRGLRALSAMVLCMASATLIELSSFSQPLDMITFLCAVVFAGGSATLIEYARTHIPSLAWTQSWKGTLVSLPACVLAFMLPYATALIMILTVGTLLSLILSGRAFNGADLESKGDYPLP